MLTLALLAGLYTSACIQTQIDGKAGHVLESYAIEKDGRYEFTRQWFEDANCSDEVSADSETGSLKLGKKMSGMFISGDTYEADFSSETGTDQGAILVKTNAIRVGRGFKNSPMRSTMVSVFDYVKK